MGAPNYTYQTNAQKIYISASKEGISACHIQICWNNCNNVNPAKPQLLSSGDSAEFDLIKMGIPEGTEVAIRSSKFLAPNFISNNVIATNNGQTAYYIFHANIAEEIIYGPSTKPFSLTHKF